MFRYCFKIFFIFMLFLSTVALRHPVCLAEDHSVVELPDPRLDRGKLLMEALKERRSLRSFSDEALDVETLSDLLWASFGVNRPASGKRTAPSAKNMQEIDIYVAMEKGLYLYDAPSHSLRLIMPEDIREFAGLQDFTQTAPVNLIYVADYSRMSGRDEVKEFYSVVDTGYISQNVYLFCASDNLATVVLGWVDRKELSKIMKLKSSQKIILTQPVGKIGL